MVRGRRQSAGLTLIELLIVIALMAILAGLVIPNSNPSIHEQLRSGGQIMVGDLAYARSLAVTHSSNYRVTFDVTANRYTIEHSGTNAALDTLPDSAFRDPDDPPTQHIVELAELPQLGPGVRIVTSASVGNLVERVQDVEFGPLGETTRSLETVIWLAAGEGASRRYLTVHVNPVTGLATIGSYSAEGPPASLLASQTPHYKRYFLLENPLVAVVRTRNRITSPFRKGTVPFSLRENWDSPQVVLLQPPSCSDKCLHGVYLFATAGSRRRLGSLTEVHIHTMQTLSRTA